METAVVTGGAKGIGAASAELLCQQGFSTAIHYHTSEEKALALSSFLVSKGYDAFPVKADISDPEQARAMIRTVLERNGRIDVLVNNAGVELWQLFDTVTDEQWRRVIDTDLSGAFYCCREALPVMLRQKYGRIVNIGSVWGQVGASCEAVYSAAKAGVIGLTKALAKETALSGITVNCVCPGAIDTDMMKRFSEAEVAAFCEEVPMGRLGAPEEVAHAVAFFASEQASYITGQVLGVNGGMV
ncbi:MAG: SDR family oxidoreductase [Clostridia bacterium]|nr:SDR family oxidoreductase [Clostridia bacterium]